MIREISQIKKDIATLCEKEQAIMAAYLFGSYAEERQKISSDLDVALLLNEKEMDSFPLLSFISNLERKVGLNADVVILNNAGEILKFEIRRHGLLVFERTRERRIQFEMKSRKYYEDFLYLHKKYVRKVLYGGANGRSSPS